ncbi:MAG: class I SAM-dependent methyltransferase, partial [Synergistales bacterium]|nr:class I SAM-dependent methyltransferase [Synergistales bacterium]
MSAYLAKQFMQQRIVLGMGSGRCGTLSLARVLSQQLGVIVSHEEPPLLPWRREPGDRVIRERFARWRCSRRAEIVGDVASFYLPYVEDAIALEPAIRIVCLKRPREEVV